MRAASPLMTIRFVMYKERILKTPLLPDGREDMLQDLSIVCWLKPPNPGNGFGIKAVRGQPGADRPTRASRDSLVDRIRAWLDRGGQKTNFIANWTTR